MYIPLSPEQATAHLVNVQPETHVLGSLLRQYLGNQQLRAKADTIKVVKSAVLAAVVPWSDSSVLQVSIPAAVCFLCVSITAFLLAPHLFVTSCIQLHV